MIANLITLSRIFLSIILLFIEPFSTAFLIIYTICGISDIMDGYIARKTKTNSFLGAKLDTISDLIFFIIMGIILYPIIISKISWIILIGLILFIRIASIIIIFKKYNTFALLHTYCNKLAGLMIFLIPYFINLTFTNVLIYIVCFISFISAIEELFITCTSKKFDPDIKSIF